MRDQGDDGWHIREGNVEMRRQGVHNEVPPSLAILAF